MTMATQSTEVSQGHQEQMLCLTLVLLKHRIGTQSCRHKLLESWCLSDLFTLICLVVVSNMIGCFSTFKINFDGFTGWGSCHPPTLYTACSLEKTGSHLLAPWCPHVLSIQYLSLLLSLEIVSFSHDLKAPLLFLAWYLQFEQWIQAVGYGAMPGSLKKNLFQLSNAVCYSHLVDRMLSHDNPIFKLQYVYIGQIAPLSFSYLQPRISVALNASYFPTSSQVLHYLHEICGTFLSHSRLLSPASLWF